MSSDEPATRRYADRARESFERAALWAETRLPGGELAVQALERERLSAAGLLAGGLAYRLFFWLVPLGLVLAALSSFWLDADRTSLEDAAREFGITGAATRAAVDAIEAQEYARWYFLVFGLTFLVWFGIGVLRALNVTHAVAWKLRPEKLRHPLRSAFAFTGLTAGVIAVSGGMAWLREENEGSGVLLTVLLTVPYAGAVVWLMNKLPHRASSWRELLPGAVLVAVGVQLMHIAVVLYIAPRLGRSSALYGSLGAATVILLWLYLIARLIVAGAFLNAAVWEQKEGDPA